MARGMYHAAERAHLAHPVREAAGHKRVPVAFGAGEPYFFLE